MLDTISLYQAKRTGSFKINLKEFNSNNNKAGQVNNYYNNFILKDNDRRNIYVKYDVNNNFMLVTFSAPKLIYGNSLENITLNDKDNLVNILTGRLTGILDADFEKWDVSRLDVSKNIEVKNNVSGYITALKKAYDVRQARYMFNNVKDESLTINNNSRRFIIYDKLKEEIANGEISRSKAKEYGNILRLEVQHKKGVAIKTSFKRKYFFHELFTEKSFQDFSKFQLQFFDKFYCNSGQYEMFLKDVALADLIFETYGKRDLMRNFFTKKYIAEHELDLSVIQDIMRKHYKTRQGLNRALRQIDQLAKLGTDTVEDVLQEIRYKLAA